MKKVIKKVFGYILISLFTAITLYALVVDIIHGGWYFLLSLIMMVALIGIVILGIYLVRDKD